MMDELSMRLGILLLKAGYASIGASLLSYIIMSRKSMLVKGLMNAKAAIAGFSAKTGILGVFVAKPVGAVTIALSTFVMLKHGGSFFRHLLKVLYPKRDDAFKNFKNSGDNLSAAD